MKSFEAEGLRVSYTDINPSYRKAIVFIHGNSQSSRSFRFQLNDSSLRVYRMIAIDLPGHGQSSAAESYSLELFTRVIASLMEELKLESFLLVGHSLGGHVAIEALKKVTPKGILIFGTPPLSHPLDMSAFKDNDYLGGIFKDELSDEEAVLLLREFYLNYTLNDEDLAEFRGTDPQFRSKMSQSFFDGRFLDEVSLFNSFTGKKAIVHGQSDRLVSREYIQEKIETEKLWRSSIVIINSSHNLHVESPIAFNELLSEFAHTTVYEDQAI